MCHSPLRPGGGHDVNVGPWLTTGNSSLDRVYRLGSQAENSYHMVNSFNVVLPCLLRSLWWQERVRRRGRRGRVASPDEEDACTSSRR